MTNVAKENKVVQKLN